MHQRCRSLTAHGVRIHPVDPKRTQVRWRLNRRILRIETPWHDLRYEKFEIPKASSTLDSHCRYHSDDLPRPSAMIKHIQMLDSKACRTTSNKHVIAVRTDSTFPMKDALLCCRGAIIEPVHRSTILATPDAPQQRPNGPRW